MIAGKRVATRLHRPQVVAVRLPELRLPPPRSERSPEHVREGARPGPDPRLEAAFRPSMRRTQGAGAHSVCSENGPAPALARAPRTPLKDFAVPRERTRAAPATTLPRAGRGITPIVVFALKLVASALAGATVTLLLWIGDASIDSSIDQAAGRQETTVYRAAPPREDVPRPERLVRSRDADPTWPDRPMPKNFSREVKTETFIAPVPQQEIVTAALGPITRDHRSNVAVPMGKPPEVKSWRYQLQDINPDTVASSSADMVVIDYAGADGPFTGAQVAQMKRKPDGSRRLVLSYMSIGEAESYRWYWPQRSSAWLGPENRKWGGNYAVRFWHADWQQIIFDYTDKIVAAGFDGVYLDKVDQFEDMGHKDDMVEFVARIAARAKSQRPDFMVISQNGDALIPDARFRKAIDAFAREDLYYGESTDGVRNSASSIRASVRRLKMLATEGKPVFVVEYPRNDEQAQTARREISELNFIGLMARRALDQL
jgi:cysteinyl-tRNA synthetase, unknown class